METINVAVVSTASIAKDKVIPALRGASSTNIVGVSSRNKERATTFASEHNAGAGFTHDEVLNDDSIDAFYIPLPSGVRNSFMKTAIEKGKHIYSEKPHSGTVSELKAILDLAQQNGVQWIDGTMWYHSNRTKVMKEHLKSLGKVLRASASFTWGNGLVDQEWVDGGNGRTDPSREPFGFLGDSGHYPISAVLWAFDWQSPTKVQALHVKRNKVGAIITCEAFLWFQNGGRAIIDCSCEAPHRSQFEVVCEKGVLKVDDLVGGQGRSGNFAAYEAPFVGSSNFTIGDETGKDTVVEVEPCDHAQCLVNEFSKCVIRIKNSGEKPEQKWSSIAIKTHTTMSAIFESAMRNGMPVTLRNDGKFGVGEEILMDIPSSQNIT
eukprot:g8061.t1